MDSNKKGASGQAPQSSGTVNLHSDSTTVEKLTILETLGPLLTKVYKSDGSVMTYDNAASFKSKEVEVGSIDELHELLTDLEPLSKNCIVRGKFVGRETAVQANKKGTYARKNQNFIDQPLHSIMIDVDKFKPPFGDPVEEPEICIDGFIRKILPRAFHGATYHWQLSSSAGQPGSMGILKAHVWFWLEKPYKCSELTAWGKVIGPMIDSAPFRLVQPHYTANPIFEEGREDPVPVRSGLFRGTHDTVPLVIGEDTLATARDTGSGQGGHDMKVIDPSEKENLIGAFHRAFSAEQVLSELLEGEFEQVTQRRWTWANGGGTPEGVWVHDDDMHVGSSHNTWPVGSSLLNLWDLVRVFKFGHLDHSEDEFEQLNIDSMPLQAKPSSKAMYDFAEGLDEVRALLREEQEQSGRERQAALENWRTQIRQVPDEYTLREKICPGIAADVTLTAGHRDALAVDLNTRLGAFGSKPGISAAKKLIKPITVKPAKDDRPEWLRGWCYVTDHDKFYRYDSEEWLTMQGFNAKYNRKVPPNAEGERLPATTAALDVHEIQTVVRGVYWPGVDAIFYEGVMAFVNTYRPSSVPKAASQMDFSGREAVKAVKAHLLHLCNGREWLAEYLTDWLAANVQKPGQKIRHSPVIQGIEGDGKSLLGTLLAQTMGEPNVRVIAPEVVSKGDFNGWAEGACVGVLEELRLQGSNRFDILNSVKPCVTNDNISIHRKRLDPYNAPNTMNYIAFTNHKDALPLDDTDRRWLVIFAPWESIRQFEEIVGCGEKDYFGHLHSMIFEQAHQLRRWLLDRDLTSFNRHGRAPDTEEKRIMVSLGVSDEVTTAKELIASGGIGYGARVVSTRMLSAALDAAGIPPPKSTAMNKMMMKLGFRQYPPPVKWKDEAHRVWTREPVTSNEVVRSLLDATAADELEKTFSD